MTKKESIKRKLIGTIVSDRMQKTRIAEIHRTKFIAKYEKYVPQTTRVKCHDEKNEYHTGDHVILEESRPLSKGKRWVIIAKQ